MDTNFIHLITGAIISVLIFIIKKQVEKIEKLDSLIQLHAVSIGVLQASSLKEKIDDHEMRLKVQEVSIAALIADVKVIRVIVERLEDKRDN